jgi:hypothetical protein
VVGISVNRTPHTKRMSKRVFHQFFPPINPPPPPPFFKLRYAPSFVDAPTCLKNLRYFHTVDRIFDYIDITFTYSFIFLKKLYFDMAHVY